LGKQVKKSVRKWIASALAAGVALAPLAGVANATAAHGQTHLTAREKTELAQAESQEYKSAYWQATQTLHYQTKLGLTKYAKAKAVSTYSALIHQLMNQLDQTQFSVESMQKGIVKGLPVLLVHDLQEKIVGGKRTLQSTQQFGWGKKAFENTGMGWKSQAGKSYASLLPTNDFEGMTFSLNLLTGISVTDRHGILLLKGSVGKPVLSLLAAKLSNSVGGVASPSLTKLITKSLRVYATIKVSKVGRVFELQSVDFHLQFSLPFGDMLSSLGAGALPVPLKRAFGDLSFTASDHEQFTYRKTVVQVPPQIAKGLSGSGSTVTGSVYGH